MTKVLRAIQPLILFFISFPLLFSQDGVVHGRVTDSETSEILPFVNIGIKGQAIGTYSDSNGFYRIELPRGDHTLVATCVGYEREERHVALDGKKEIILDFAMDRTTQELNTVVVTGSKYEQKIQESISSIEVLKAQYIYVSNPASIDQAIDKIPGITIVDNEPQIRGGSGFSSGLGSRVMVMVDEIPILRGDAGRPSWGFLPVDDVEQIEVVKGASSVIYGSSAITGAINIRSAYPKDKPVTRLNTFLGCYWKPDPRYSTPWTGINPLMYGVSFSHLHKFDNFDLGIGANYYDDQGYIRGTPEMRADTAFNKGQFERRAKFYFNTRIRNKKIDGLTYGLNGNFMFSNSAETFFWYDADTNIYRSYPGALSHFRDFSFFVDPYIKYFNDRGGSHSFKNRIYFGNTHANNNQSNGFLTIYSEYQYTREFRKLGGLMLVTGIMNTYAHSDGQVFSGRLAADNTPTTGESGTYDSDNLAIYLQLEKKFWNRLTVLVGSRWEYYQIAGDQENRPIFRAGLNVQATRGTYVRASVGQGYRVPSIGERYITTTSGGFGFYPNPNLISETILSYELGVKQLFKIGRFGGMVDIAGFYEDYKNYVEFNFGIWGDTVLSKSFGFKFLNTGPARIYGIDCTLAGEGKLARNLDCTILFGYTYSVPQALDPDLVYYTHFEKATQLTRNYTYTNTSTDTAGYILKYRMQQIAKADFQLTFKTRLSTGVTGRYYGFMKNIDNFLYDLDPTMHSGIVKYREEHHDGNFIVDFRISYMIRDFRISFLVNNIFNTPYSLRPMTIEAPRTTSLQVVMTI
jgi:iron complex outermembrane receptor protein